jgi:hypothetical protein
MRRLVDGLEASEQARERGKVILSSLARECSVAAACRVLGMGRTRFQDLRKRMLRAALAALEERPAGRPRVAVARTCRQAAQLRRRLALLEHELLCAQAELDVARSAAGPAVKARLIAKRGAR